MYDAFQVNRAQIEIKKAVGNPAQTQAISDLSSQFTLNHKIIETLEKRVDTLQEVCNHAPI